MPTPKFKQLSELLRGIHFSNHNLHRIAISNLADGDRRLIRWWCKKYRTPIKPLFDYTSEELLIEYLEDFYDNNPIEIERFMHGEASLDADDWDGRMPDDYEREIKAKLASKRQINVEQFKSDEVLTPDQERAIMDNLGRNLPRSKAANKPSNNPNKTTIRGGEPIAVLGDDEVEEDFGGS